MEATVLLFIGAFIFGLIYMNVINKSNIFGVILGISLIITGLFILSDGVEFVTGYTKTFNETTLLVTLNNTYVNLQETQPLLNETLGIVILLIGVYVMINSGLNLSGKRQVS